METMHKRRKEAVIRFHKISRDKDPSNFFRSKLMLYFPWRTERVDLLGHFDSFADHYNDVVEIVKNKEMKNCRTIHSPPPDKF